ncbi:MAG TPA: DUF4369 domain-containing protein [Niastella sp.]
MNNRIISISKKTFLFLNLLALVGEPAFANDHKELINIKGETAGSYESRKIYLQRYYNKMFFVIDSSIVSGGKFSFSTKLEIPELYSVTFDTILITPLYVFIESKNGLHIHFDTAN